MKKTFILLSSLFLLILIQLHAEGYQLSFIASGAGAQLDQVEVQNLRTGSGLLLTGSDILQLGGSVNNVQSVNSKKDIELKLQSDYHLVHLSAVLTLESADKVTLSVYDMTGRAISRDVFDLSPGSHTFSLSGFGRGTFLVNALTSTSIVSAKFISNSTDYFPSVILTGTYGKSSRVPIFRSRSEVKLLNDYEEGDKILLKASSGNHKRIVVLQPDKSSVVDFNFIECKDSDGNHYAVVRIGDQYWMAENLNTTKYNNGDVIGTTSNPTQDISTEQTPKYQWAYDGNESNADIFGRLYTWYVQEDSRGIAPEGWSVPSDDQWNEMIELFGGNEVAGTALKDVGTTLWNTPNYATNETGFTALPGGLRRADGTFERLNTNGWFIERDENISNPTSQYARRLSSDSDAVGRYNVSKMQAGYIRCIKNVVEDKWSPVPEIDMSLLSPSDFNDDEIDMPYYLKHLPTLANSVVRDGANKGFLNIHVYRSTDENIPGNARIMENILSLVYFYTKDRSWNIYYNSPNLGVRIEAAFEYLLTLQKSTNLFPDQNYPNGGMGATAFITKFIGEALVLLHKPNSPIITTDLLNRVMESQRKAIMVLLTDDAQYNQGKSYTNQYTNVFAGALAYLSIKEDAQMRQKLIERLDQASVDFQSELGYFLEGTGNGPDFGYNMNTSFSNLWMCYHYSRGTDLAQQFQKEANSFAQWIKYNAVLEPDKKTFTLNRSIASRTEYGIIEDNWFIVKSPFGELNNTIRAFINSQDELNTQKASKRKELASNWPNVGTLSIGSSDAYNPYTFLHRGHYTWHADSVQKDASKNELPYIKHEQFNHQKRDSKKGFVFTYLKRPKYYAAFASGPKAAGGQRYGLTLLWNQESGAFMQSVRTSNTAAWGTMKSGATTTYEASISAVTFFIGDKAITPTNGSKDLPEGPMILQYAISGTNTKKLTFDSDTINVDVNHTGEFTEYIPLLVGKNDVLTTTRPGFVTLKSGNTTIRIDHSAIISRQFSTDVKSGDKTIVVIKLTANEKLNYSISFN